MIKFFLFVVIMAMPFAMNSCLEHQPNDKVLELVVIDSSSIDTLSVDTMYIDTLTTKEINDLYKKQ